MQTQVKSIQKLITFSPQLYQLVLNKAKKLGLSFPQYIRVIAVNEVKENIEGVPVVDLETEKNIEESLVAYKKGEYTVLATDEEIKKHFNNLQKNV